MRRDPKQMLLLLSFILPMTTDWIDKYTICGIDEQ